MVELNSIVPDFSLMGSDEKEHKLSDYKGKKVVLYFYPRDNTPGCSTEACDFRDNHSNFIDNNVVILGVSRDSLKSHNKFIEKLNLPFVLFFFILLRIKITNSGKFIFLIIREYLTDKYFGLIPEY